MIIMANVKRKYVIRAEIKDCEIRKVEDVDASFVSRDGKQIESHYIELTCDVGDACERIYLKDRDMSNLGKYHRGQVGTFHVRIDVEEGYGSKTKINVVSFDEKVD